jgi:hypothetical protein
LDPLSDATAQVHGAVPTFEPVSNSRVQALESQGTVVGFNFSYCAPSERRPARNRPDRFLHFTIIPGESRHDTSNWIPLGARTPGEQMGMLYRVPLVGGFFSDHFVFRWKESGIPLEASLHSWDKRREVLALLDVLIASLENPSRR